ncbi:aldolase/citrate lyase family protein [Cognatishimia sp. SS12]|uniref:HpcH/HpaI aldolase family protein n=1 Tax=Cognatishimia sp. SS12 TaxID=2979465 RepID=UPI00232BD40E|nr:aldolase/citrate lyase family protein [Cognatishimia sp. SS12]MDC0739349.1 aldolase/citrate lyase family protein [Cognatishimia sp. SS12]
MPQDTPRFADHFRNRQPLVGTFVKMASTMPTEILGLNGYDFVVVDEEHAPLNRETTDRILLACRAVGIGGLVRVQSADPAAILSVLDCGADGVLVPHIKDAADAALIAQAARYRPGRRGYAATTRAGAFGGQGIAAHIAEQDHRATVIAMIEDPEALEDIEAIVATEGIDGVFIGRGDLTVAFGEDAPGSAPVRAATSKIIAAARAAGKTVSAMAGSPEDAQALFHDGVTTFVVGSDQTFLRTAAIATLAGTRAALKPKG